MTTTTRRRGRAVSGLLVAALAFGGTLVGLPGVGGSLTVQAAGLQTISLEAVNENVVPLGALASRSQRNPVTIAGIGPYTLSGTDSRTGDPYSFVTDSNYDPVSRAPWGLESDERVPTSFSSTGTPNTPTSYGGRDGVLRLGSNGQCPNNNVFDGLETYCSVFGPEVYSAPFDAVVGQSVSFDWAAEYVSDDYETYAFLVEVQETGPGVYDYGTPASHSLLSYGRGTNQTWKTDSGAIPRDGSYRFRFVNGTYDKSGFWAVGSAMYIDSVVRVGESNPISFTQPGDVVDGAGVETVALTATVPSPGPAVTFASTTPSVCTVSGATATVVGLGVCAISADHPGDGVTYVPSKTEVRSFRVLAAAIAPTNSGVPLIQGSPVAGGVVTATEGTWGDGGSPITSTVAQFESNGAPISGVPGTSCVLVADAASTLTYKVTKTNAVGSTTETSAALAGFTCTAADAPMWTDNTLGALTVGTVFAESVAASGTPTPTYSVVNGALPDGLTLDSTTGAITGTPTTAGAYSFTVEADNGVGAGITTVFSGTVATAAVAPSITYGGLSGLVTGTAIPAAVPVVAADPAPTFSVTAGALPAGLALDEVTGAITGTPTTAGAYSFTVTATNVAGSDDAVFSGTVAAPAPTPAPTPTVPPTVDVTPPTQPDEPIVVRGTGFTPGTKVEIVVDGEVVDTVTVDENGEIDAKIPAPDGSSYSVELRPQGSDDAPMAPSRRVITGFDGKAVTVPLDSGYVPLVPNRVLDTRESGERLGAGETYRLAVGSDWDVPESATTVALNVTATRGAGEGFLTVFPCGGDMPLASVVNYVPGTDTPNLSLVAPGENDEICIFSQWDVDLVVDLNGYFADDVDARLVSETPVRLIDTRDGDPIPAGEAVEIQVTGGELALNTSTAAVVNVVAVNAASVGYLTLFPCDQDMPLASNINYEPGSTNAGQAYIKLSPTGTVCVYSPVEVDIVVDMNASFIPGDAAQLVSNTPTRVLDTRETGALDAGETVVLALGGTDGVEGATAVAVNLTVTESQGEGFITAYPCLEGLPLASSVNLAPGRSVANHSTAKPDADGNVCIYTSTATHLVVDVEGVYM